MVKQDPIVIIAIIGIALFAFIVFFPSNPVKDTDQGMTITVYDSNGNVLSQEGYTIQSVVYPDIQQSLFDRERGVVRPLKEETVAAIRLPEAARAVITFTVENTGDLPINFDLVNNEFVGVESE